jgi:hypothetical protein
VGRATSVTPHVVPTIVERTILLREVSLNRGIPEVPLTCEGADVGKDDNDAYPRKTETSLY